MDLKPFQRAALTPKDVSALTGVCYQTARMWMRGTRKPHFLMYSRVEPVLRAVEAAVEADELPLALDTPRDKRLARLRRVLRKYQAK